MAYTWGKAAYSGANGARLGYTITRRTVGTNYEYSLEVAYGTRRSVYDSYNSYSVTGSFGSESGSRNISHPSSTAWANANITVIARRTVRVTPKYGSTSTVSFSASMSGIEAVPGTVTVSKSVTVPQRPYEKPRPPKSPTVKRINDTKVEISWTRDEDALSGARPWTGVKVLRWDPVTRKTVQIKAVPRASATYTDTTTVANRLYQYVLIAYNPAGDSTSIVAGRVKMTPAAPTGMTAKKQGSDILVSWTNRGTPDLVDRTEIYEARDGVWQSTPIASVAGTATSWTHVNPSTEYAHAYRSIAVATTYGRVASPYGAASNTVTLLAPPLAPTGQRPAGAALDADEDATFTFTHNPVDTTDLTAYELRYRERIDVGTAPWVTTGKKPATTGRHLLPGGILTNGTRYEWQVRTWGDHVDPSPWSALAAFPTSARPTVFVEAPEADTPIRSSTLTTEWSFYDPEGSAQTQWRAELWRGEDRLETKSGTGQPVPVTFATKGENDTTYRIVVAGRDDAGLWSPDDSRDVRIEYARPPKPELDVTFDPDTGQALLNVDAGEAYTFSYEGEAGTSTSVAARSDGTIAARQYATNGSFEVAGGTVEVARNLFPAPDFGPDRFTVSGVDKEALPDGWTRLKTNTTATTFVSSKSPFNSCIPITKERGKTMEQRIDVRALNAIRVRLGALQYDETGVELTADRVLGDYIDLEAGEERTLSLPVPVAASAAGMRYLFYVMDHGATAYSAGNVVDVQRPQVAEPGAHYVDADFSPDPDLMPRLNSDGTASLVATTVQGITGGWQTDQWAIDGTHSLRVPDNQTATLPAATNRHYEIDARHEQTITLGDTSTTGTGRLTLTGPGTLTLGPGYWDNLTIGDADTGNPIGHYWTGDNETTVDTTSIDIYRRVDDGPWTHIADNLDPITALTDYIPGIHNLNEYRAEATSALPSVRSSDITTLDTRTNTAGWIFVNTGDSYDQWVRYGYNGNISDQPARTKILKEFRGRTYPLEFTGETRSHTYSTKATLGHDTSTRKQITDLADLPGPACLRAPAGLPGELGDRAFVSTGSPDFSRERISGEFSWDFAKIDHDEN